MAMMLHPNFEQIPPLKANFNVGALFDVPTGRFVLGRHGESILNGGVGLITGVVGKGNRFKTTITRFLMIMILARFSESLANTYDTEMNIQEQDILRFIIRCGLNPMDFFHSDGLDRWHITDGSIYFGDQWFAILKEFFQNKTDNLEKWLRQSPFLDRDGKTLLRIPVPTLTDVDSFSVFQTSDVVKMVDDNDLGESGRNTIYMRQGLSKKQFLTEIPRWASRICNPMFLTAHIGKNIPMDARAMPEKRLQHMAAGEDLKGVTGDFSYLTTFCIQANEAYGLLNDKTRTTEYPRNAEDSMDRDTDLNIVKITYLRNKNGRSGLTAEILVSQGEGVLPSLTEFYYSKKNDKDYRYCYNGHDKAYQHALLPNVSLQRTSVRTKLDTNSRLRRAVLIGSEMTQMRWLWQNLESKYKVSPAQLYTELKNMGYKWEELLDTRSWWTFDNDTTGEPFLSTMDLLRMRTGEYHPFWMKSKPGDAFVAMPNKEIPSAQPA